MTDTTQNAAADEYSSVAEKASERILALIPECPEILTLDSAWGLFKVEGFKCKDLGLTLFQASWALNDAQKKYLARTQ